MQKIVKAIDVVLSRFLIALMATIVLAVTWQVITRFLMASPSSYTEELARFLLIWIGILGAAYALRTRAHLGIDLITHKVGARGRLGIEILVNSMIILFALFVMIIGGTRLVLLTLDLEQTSASMGLMMGYIYLVLPLSGALMIIYASNAIYEAVVPPNPSSGGSH